MSARVRAGPRLGGLSLEGLSLEGLSLEDLSPGGPLFGGPPVSVPAGFGVVPIPGVGVMLDGVPVPIPGVGVMPVPGLAPVPIPGVGAMKVPPPPPIPPPPIPGEGAREPPVPCARAVPAAFLCLLGRLRATSPQCGSKERQGQLEQFERDESGPCGAGDEADWNGRDNKHVLHDLHPGKLEGRVRKDATESLAPV
jgi:hypothetical protein